jgi:hypothetical protein
VTGEQRGRMKTKIEYLKEAEGICMLLGCVIDGAAAVFVSGQDKSGLICMACLAKATEHARCDTLPKRA